MALILELHLLSWGEHDHEKRCRGKRCSTYTVFNEGGVLLPSTEDIARLWKKYLKELLNLADCSLEEAQSGGTIHL